MKLHLLIILLFVNISFTFSQRKFKRFNYVDGLSITPNVGIGSIAGELGDILHFNTVYGINLEKGLSEKVNVNFDLVGGVFNGSENKIYNSNFKNEFFQIQFYPTVNLSRLYSDKVQRTEFNTYAGIGLVWFHTNVFDYKSGAFLRTTSDGTTKHTALFQQAGVGVGEKGIYYTRELIVPIGFIVKHELSNKFALIANLGYNFVYNDKFDGTTPYNLANPNIVGGVNSYSDTANDGWLKFSIGIKYIISSLITENQRGV